ncbi:MAG TPA: SUF system NifU family Fe-S cluster assembly protein [Paraburkholderia sp.]|nr:SUF system NifU family Fe-S cluster assembly protein [Paraburkholderia sp.]
MNDLSELYQEVIFDHYRRPRNRGVLAGANRKAEGYNPLCGDRVTLYLRIEDGIVREASFEGSGCAIATASASLMTDALKGKTEAEAQALSGRFRDMVTTSGPVWVSAPDLGKLAALSGVREFPARVKCATLAWHTLHAALQGENSTVSTE